MLLDDRAEKAGPVIDAQNSGDAGGALPEDRNCVRLLKEYDMHPRRLSERKPAAIWTTNA
jgi:hypothetical protein